jgi:hypothetical protein
MSTNQEESKEISNVYIVDPIGSGWIIEKLMLDIKEELKQRGIKVNVGDGSDYSGEEIVFHSRYLYARPIKNAKLNSIFVTHVDDILKKNELIFEAYRNESIVCMSPSDAQAVINFGLNKDKVIGLNLPHRGGYIRRPRVCIFSDWYDDLRKNENWILDFVKNQHSDMRSNIIFVFMGRNWEKFCGELSKLGASFELINYSRAMPGEYELQKEKLASVDYMLYAGFDGGAMCSYDGLMANVPMVLSNDSYHVGLSKKTILVDSKEDLYRFLLALSSDVSSSESVLKDRSISTYVDKLMEHWLDRIYNRPKSPEIPNNISKIKPNQNQVKFNKLTLRRVIGFFYRFLIKTFSWVKDIIRS